MLFCSERFVLFFAAVLAAYWALPWARARVWLLLGASYYFYACWNPRLALLICASTTVDYFLARGIEARPPGRGRRLLLLVNITGNLGLLCYFKYANFFLHSLEQALRAAGASAALPTLRVILPVGISFYTFEAINYMVDVYRGQARAERSLPHFMLFILFFPHLVAGPVARARDFLPLVRRAPRRPPLGPPPCTLLLAAHAGRRAALPHGPLQEAGGGRPHGPVRRPGVRRPCRLPQRRRLDRRPRLRAANLLRLLRLHR